MLADLGHHLGVGLLIDRWVWWLFRWQMVVMFLNFCGFLSWSSCYEEMFLIGKVVVAWLCQSLVVGSGFNCVGLGLIVLIWVCCDWFLDLGLVWVGLLIGFMGLIHWECGVDCVRIWGRTWGIRWSCFVVDLMVLDLMISEVLNLSFFFLFSFMS